MGLCDLALLIISECYLSRAPGACRAVCHRLPAAILTPLAVRPDRQQLGIGTRLMVHSLEALEANGEDLFFVLGHPSYYPRAGFRSELAENVLSPWPCNPAFMARANFVPGGRLILPSEPAARR
jgi:GNAT superfamily N-acetyltransferase